MQAVLGVMRRAEADAAVQAHGCGVIAAVMKGWLDRQARCSVVCL